MLMVFNLAQTVGFYGFANWVSTLLIAKGIHITQSLEYTFIIALAYPLWPLISMTFADRIERKWQVCIAALGIAVFGFLFSTQTAAAALIAIGLCQTAANTWLSFSFHNYQSELYPTRVRARAVGFVYSWSRISVVFTSYVIAFVLHDFGVLGVFTFIALAMAVVILSIALFGPKTNQLAPEAISR